MLTTLVNMFNFGFFRLNGSEDLCPLSVNKHYKYPKN